LTAKKWKLNQFELGSWRVLPLNPWLDTGGSAKLALTICELIKIASLWAIAPEDFVTLRIGIDTI